MKSISFADFLMQEGQPPLLDVRSPSEFAHGHVPGAKNLPLFTDEERSEVGTLYKQVGQEQAFLRGLDIAGGKMSAFVKQTLQIAPEKKVAVHCWRGGKRSGSVGTLLSFAGFQTQVLQGGYKAYRHFVLEQFAIRKMPFIILGGKTGSGKTEILRHLAALGEQIIDLEALAHHKGSAFGALGEQSQPTVEQFENDLFDHFHRLDPNRRVWVENESRSIGRVFIPEGFWSQIKSSPLIQVEVPFELRVQRLLRDYGHFSKEELVESLRKIERRMGGQHLKAALEAFYKGDLQTATAIALNYYDKTYLHATSKGNFSRVYELPVQDDCLATAKKLVDFSERHITGKKMPDTC